MLWNGDVKQNKLCRTVVVVLSPQVKNLVALHTASRVDPQRLHYPRKAQHAIQLGTYLSG